MTELIRLIELDEVKNIRVTCNTCSVAVKIPVRDLGHKLKCPSCGKDYGIIYDSLLDLKEALLKRKGSKDFEVHIELFEND